MIRHAPALRSVPWLTVGVFLLTGLVTGSQFVWPGVLTALRREPAMVGGGEYWRFVSPWLVHDGGALQIVFNFTALLIIGALVERWLGRGLWALGYVIAGLVGEVAGLFWQPAGAGNSVAIAGLAGLAAVHVAGRADWPMRARLVYPAIVAAGAIGLTAVSDIHGPALLAGLATGAVARLVRPTLFRPAAVGAP